MKTIKQLLLVALTFVVFSISTFALTEGDWEFQLLDDEVRITRYLGNNTNITIPDTIFGTPVTQIDSDTFYKRGDTIISLSFPATVKVIESALCDGWDNLETIVLPNNLEVIESCAFRDCANLKNVQLPPTIKTLKYSAFSNCTSLKSINFPSSLESIVGSLELAVFGGSGLESIDLSQTTVDIGKGTFANCQNLTSVKFNDKMTKIPSYAFFGCSSLESIDIPFGVTEIGGFAFAHCKSLKNIVLPVSLTKIDNYGAFSYCDSLTEVVIPYGTKYLGGHTFEKCVNLKSVYVPDTVTTIGILDIIEDCPNAIVYCTQNSEIAKYCKQKQISYLTDKSVNSEITVLYNGTRVSFHTYDQNPELINNRTLVPLRSIFEAMGAEISWDGATSTATAVRDGVTIKITIGANEIYKDGVAIPVDVPAQIVNSRTMVPTRVIAEAFGANVEWVGSGRTVLITE